MSSLPFATRIWFAWAAFFRVLFDGAFAARVWQARSPELLPSATRSLPPELKPLAKPPPPPSADPALQLLALFQREGRLVDFLEQDITSFKDDEVGAAARVVHDGCRKALRAHTSLAPVRTEEEGARLELAEGFSPAEVKLSGDVKGNGPYKGVLRHRGWRATELRLPVPAAGYDPHVLAPAEVEL